MYEIEYKIGLNEQGRPYIELPEDYEQRPEDRFFAIEITRYILQDLLKRRSPDLDPHTIGVIDEAERLLGQLGDEIAEILYEGMRTQGDFKMMMGGTFHVGVNSVEERNELPDKDILYDKKIFDRIEGLKVAVFTPLEGGGTHVDRYELVDGITNEHWIKI
jgi:hypothetical protein